MPLRMSRVNGKREIVTAFTSAPAGSITGGTNAAGTSQSTAYLLGADLRASLLENIFDVTDPKELQATYRDIYYHDAISGTAVDMRANMPWSDFTLIGANDEILKDYYEVIEKLNVKIAHKHMAADQMVAGAFVASLVYDDKKSVFSDMIPMNYGDCELIPVPLYSQDPVIKLNISEELQQFAMNEDSAAIKSYKEGISPEMLKRFKEGKPVYLDPLSTIYLPRATMSVVQSGVSYYRRVLPCYLLERIIYRGTITEATKRQRSTLHVTVGDTEDYVVNEEDLEKIVGLFQVTEEDPLSSIVATRGNIQVSEILQHSDIWSWSTVASELREIKLQALGISDAFVTADGTFDALQSGMTVFIEDLRAYRETFTSQFYYKKLFPLVSMLKNHSAEEVEKKEESAVKDKTEVLMNLSDKLNDSSNLLIPTIQWHKQLKPSGDQEYMDRLALLQEKGMPIPMSMWAASAGLSIDQVLNELKGDPDIREKLDEYKPKRPAGEEDEGEFGSVVDKSVKLGPPGTLSNITKREHDEKDMEVIGKTKTGEDKYIPNQTRARRELNEKASLALNSLSDPNEYARALRRANKQPNPIFRYTK